MHTSRNELRIPYARRYDFSLSGTSESTLMAVCQTSILASLAVHHIVTILQKLKNCWQRQALRMSLNLILSYNAGDPVQEPIAILYQSALREIGVNLNLEKVPAGSFYNAVSQREKAMIFYVDSPWCPDPGYSMTLYFDSESFVNYSNYVNSEVDGLLKIAAETADETVRLDNKA